MGIPNLLIDKNVTLTLKGGGGTPTYALTAANNRTVGSITVSENGPTKTLVRGAAGTVLAEVETGNPDSFGTVTVALYATGDTFCDNAAAQFFDIVRGLMFQDAAKIAGAAWTTAFAFPLGGGCDFAVDLDLAVTFCTGGASITKTLALGAATVRGGISTPFGETGGATSVTFELLEEINWLAWA